MRTFFAIEIPEKQKNDIGELQRELKKTGAGIAWVRPENIHITLKFLGEIADDRLSVIYGVAEKLCLSLGGFPIEISETGVFPDNKRPRIVWVGIRGGKTELKGVAEGLEIGLTREGFPREERPFKPHITIGRIKSPQNVPAAMARLREIPFETDRYGAAEIVVMKSELKPGGAVYTPLRKIPFGIQ